jgi:quercetin dioxygenase-like cupin family protein
MNDQVAAALTAWVDTAADQQLIKWLGKTRLRVLADAARTGGQVTIVEEFSGTGDASPLHLHRHEDEMFWLLEGAMTAWVGDQRFELAPGGFAFLPRGIAHAYRFPADQSRALLVTTPAGIETCSARQAGT